MKISVVMIDGGFRERFHVLDSLVRQSFAPEDFEIIWVEFYERAADAVRSRPRLKVIELGHSPQTLYHSSKCFNAGIAAASGEVIAIPDADIVVGEGFLETVWNEHARYEELALYFQRFDQDESHSNGDVSLEYLRGTCRLVNPTNYGGCLTVRRRWLVEMNGYEEHRAFASNYHANGTEIYTRLKNLGLAVKWHPTERLYHPWHPGTAGPYEKSRLKWQMATAEARARSRIVKACLGMDGKHEPDSEPPPPPHGDPDETADAESGTSAGSSGTWLKKAAGALARRRA